MTLRDVRGVLRHPRELALEKLLPDAWCLLPRGRDSFTDRTFASLGAPDVHGQGAEEYLWRDEPFAFHLRGASQRLLELDGLDARPRPLPGLTASAPLRRLAAAGRPRAPGRRAAAARAAAGTRRGPAAGAARAGRRALERGHHARRGVGVQPVRADERAQEGLPRARSPLRSPVSAARRSRACSSASAAAWTSPPPAVFRYEKCTERACVSV